LSHSHLAIRHLIRELELRGRRRSSPPVPTWLTGFLCEASELFEPFTGTARAGYECRRTEEGWTAALFLGANETVGGPEDGRVRRVSFRFDAKSLARRFDRIDSLVWTALPQLEAADDLSFLSVVGTVRGELLRLEIYASPPEGTGPGMRIHADGRVELA
jgi:hypothetical protein